MTPKVDLSVQIGNLRLKNPVLTASGTFGYGDELARAFDPGLLGGIVTKGLTLRPRKGNPPPRIKETPCGMLNSIGLENIGLERFLEEKLPILRRFDTAIVVNVNGEMASEYEEMVERLDEVEGVDALEINVSCPNVERGGVEFGQNPRLLERLIASLRKRTRKPLWVKLTPNFVDVAEEARAAEAGGADAVSLINTLFGMWIDTRTGRSALGTPSGGLSGPAIFPFALYCVHRVAQTVRIPVIGIGGITEPDQAIQMLLAGAVAIQIGTATFLDPLLPLRVLEGIRDYMARHRLDSIGVLIGGLK